MNVYHQTDTPDIRLIAVDFDLTIYDHANPGHTLDLQPWFEKLTDANVLTGIASGRSVPMVREALDSLDWQWADPFPAYIVGYEGEIYQSTGDDYPGLEATNRQRRQLVKQANVELESHFEVAGQWAKKQGLTCIDPIRCSPSGVNVVYETPAEAELVRAYLAEQLADETAYTIGRNHHIVIGLAADCGKGAALHKLAKQLGLEPAQVLAIGDSLNDWSMLCEDHGFTAATPSNGDPAIRNHIKTNGGYIAHNPISRGVIELFEHFFPDLVEEPLALAR